MTTIVSFDPGKATGVAQGSFDESTPLSLLGTLIVDYVDWQYAWFGLLDTPAPPDVVVVERFDLANNDFKADLTGIKVEGTLELLYGDDIHWRSRTEKEQVPDNLLKEIGWWRTGSDMDWSDGRDANDAIIHMLGYVAFELNHLPTLRKYFR